MKKPLGNRWRVRTVASLYNERPERRRRLQEFFRNSSGRGARALATLDSVSSVLRQQLGIAWFPHAGAPVVQPEEGHHDDAVYRPARHPAVFAYGRASRRPGAGGPGRHRHRLVRRGPARRHRRGAARAAGGVDRDDRERRTVPTGTARGRKLSRNGATRRIRRGRNRRDRGRRCDRRLPARHRPAERHSRRHRVTDRGRQRIGHGVPLGIHRGRHRKRLAAIRWRTFSATCPA